VPIFESDEKATDKEFRRQQMALNDKVLRLSWKKMVEDQDETDTERFGDCWEEEAEESQPES